MAIPLFILCVMSFTSHGGVLTPHLTEENLKRAIQIRETKPTNYQSAEEEYQTLTQKQTLSDLLEFYKPENKDKIKIVYASFTPENTKGGGDDLGFGLHIVKRLIRRLPDGTEKVTDINELWPEERETGGLLLPDEIRIKTLAVEGKRKVPGSHKLFLFDSIRIAWGPANDEVLIARRTRHTGNEVKQMRVPVSAPFSCKGCHNSMGGSNPEAIVEEAEFSLPADKQRGFQEYVEYLEASGKKPKFIEEARTSLLDVENASKVPGIKQALERAIQNNEKGFLHEDESLFLSYPTQKNELLLRQGYYEGSDGTLYKDVIEDLIEGKYRWWDPVVVIPPLK